MRLAGREGRAGPLRRSLHGSVAIILAVGEDVNVVGRNTTSPFELGVLALVG